MGARGKDWTGGRSAGALWETQVEAREGDGSPASDAGVWGGGRPGRGRGLLRRQWGAREGEQPGGRGGEGRRARQWQRQRGECPHRGGSRRAAGLKWRRTEPGAAGPGSLPRWEPSQHRLRLAAASSKCSLLSPQPRGSPLRCRPEGCPPLHRSAPPGGARGCAGGARVGLAALAHCLSRDFAGQDLGRGRLAGPSGEPRPPGNLVHKGGGGGAWDEAVLRLLRGDVSSSQIFSQLCGVGGGQRYGPDETRAGAGGDGLLERSALPAVSPQPSPAPARPCMCGRGRPDQYGMEADSHMQRFKAAALPAQKPFLLVMPWLCLLHPQRRMSLASQGADGSENAFGSNW